jgi:hypothetical protein
MQCDARRLSTLSYRKVYARRGPIGSDVRQLVPLHSREVLILLARDGRALGSRPNDPPAETRPFVSFPYVRPEPVLVK